MFVSSEVLNFIIVEIVKVEEEEEKKEEEKEKEAIKMEEEEEQETAVEEKDKDKDEVPDSLPNADKHSKGFYIHSFMFLFLI
jgi:vacuolar-type H+-ATPase subunit I/STV1